MDSGAFGAVNELRPARLPDDLPRVRQLFPAYAENLEFHLCFKNFDDELATLPGKYAAPMGRLILAWAGDQASGCVALRPVDATTAEMKRLYVHPGQRGQHLGRRLAEHICREAREAGYQRICLETLPAMTSALQLYEALGFKPVEPYVVNPLDGAIFLGLDLIGHLPQPTDQ
jgi:ribosomal protein S18 acetylase RimI-like enzyme